ncbi:MAG: Cof-type HAD-IIB family hydrolase, partial [Pseudoflavonifractor sp.]
MEYKLIALDMDGTLLDDDHATIPPRNLTALRAAAERGAEIVIATGRSFCLAEDTARALGCVRYTIFSNGAAVRDVERGVCCHQSSIPAPQALEMVRILHKHQLPFEVYCAGGDYMEPRHIAQVSYYTLSKRFSDLFTRRIILTEDIEGIVLTKAVEKFNIFGVPAHRREEVLSELSAAGPVLCASAYSATMELTSPLADKGSALAALCGDLGIAPHQVMAFGDAQNDVSMLTWAGCSCAMENGSDAAKAAAKHLVPANTE